MSADGELRVVMKTMDTAIELIKLEHLKTRREVETIKINEPIGLLRVQAEKADQFLKILSSTFMFVSILSKVIGPCMVVILYGNQKPSAFCFQSA